MATAEADTSRGERVPAGGVVYDGFISYSHAADDLLAPRLQAGLQRFAKPWWKRRALRIFRDESSLSANPHLWSSITDALDRSAWFVLLLSPDAAASPWVNQEVEYWVEHKDSERIIPVLTDGEFGWAEGDVTGDAVPPALEAAFSDEPRWVDLRFARNEDQLDLNNPRFSAAVADVASAIRGVPKDELESEEVRQHRRTVRTVWGAAFALLTLVIAASGTAVFAIGQQTRANDEAFRANQLAEQEAAARQDAENQREAAVAAAEAEATARANADRNAELARSRELSASAINVLDEDAELSVLLALEAAATDDPPIEATSALHEALGRHRVLHTYRYPEERSGFGSNVDLHPNGRYLVAAGIGDYLEVWDMEAGETVWSMWWPGKGAIGPQFASFSDDGERVMAGIAFWPLADTTDEPLREELGFFVWDAMTGEAVTRFDTGPCGSYMVARPSASHALVETPVGDVCDFFGDVDLHLLDLGTGNITFLTTTGGIHGAALSADGSTIAFDDVDGIAHIVDLASGEEVLAITAADRDLSQSFNYVQSLNPDGNLLLYGDRPIQVWDTETGNVVSQFDGHDGESSGGAFFSEDGRLVYSAGRDGTVRIWDPATGSEIDVLAGAQFPSEPVLSPDGATMLVSDLGADVVRQWDLDFLPGEIGAIQTCPAFIAADSLQIVNDRAVVSMVCDGDYHSTPHVVDVASMEIEGLLPLNSGQMPALSPDGSRLAQLEGGENTTQGPIRIYDIATTDPVVTMDTVCVNDSEVPLSQQPQCVEPPETPFALWPSEIDFSPDGLMLVAVDNPNADGFVAIWDADTGDLLHVHNAPRDLSLGVAVAAIFLDDARLWIDYGNRAFQVLDTGTWEVVEQVELPGDAPLPGQTSLLARNNNLLVGTTENGLVWYDTSTWEQVRATNGLHRGTIKDMDINPAETMIATGGSDGFVRVWDFDTGALVHQIPISGGQAQNVGFITDEHLMVTPQDGNISVFTIDTAELLDIARRRVTRGFTDSECETYHIDPCPTLEEMRGS